MAAQPALKQDLSESKPAEKSLQVTKKTNGYDDDLYDRFILWKDQTGYSTTRIASMMARSAAGVSQYINKKYEGSIAEIEKDVSQLLRRAEELEFTIKPQSFCPTTPARLIWEVLQYCDKHQDMGVAVGKSGLGKTQTCNEYKRQNRSVILITADIYTRSCGAILYMLTSRVGKGSNTNSNSAKFHNLIDNLKNSNRMVIVDDAHFLHWEAFEALRKIHDCGKVGVVFVGQERLYDQMRGAAGKSYLYDQIYSRIAIRRDDLPIAKADVKMVSKSLWADLDKDHIEFLWKKAQGSGKFRGVEKIVKLAKEMHDDSGKPLDIALFEEASRFLMI